MKTINKSNESVKALVETHEPEAVFSTLAKSVISEKNICLIHHLTAGFMQLTRNMTLCLYRNIELDKPVIQTFIFMVGYIKLCPQSEVISQEGAKI
jgi:hypothetical protein